MFRRQVFTSDLATKCRFCGCPVVDDCVSLSTVDAAKLSNWSVARTGVPIAEKSAAASWSCMNCVREAKRFCEKNPFDELDCVWWDEIKDRYFNYYKNGWMKSCSVAVTRLPEKQVMRPLRFSQEVIIKQEVKEEVVIEEQEREVKVEIFDEEGNRMEVDSDLSSGRLEQNKDTMISTSQKILCRYCNLLKRSNAIKNHIKTVSCPFCRKSFPCWGLLRCHEADCFKKCPLCSKKVKTVLLLDKHLNVKHKTKDGFWQNNQVVPCNHVCNKCNEGFPTKNKLTRHKVTCNVRYICDKCGAKYCLKYKFLCHLYKEHNLKIDLDLIKRCKKCNKFFFTEESLRIHESQLSCYSRRSTGLLVACKYCGNNFVDGVLQRHEISCQRTKKTKNNKVQEVQPTSTKHFTLICQVCGKKFNHNVMLDKHLYQHHMLGVLPLQCVHCKMNIVSLKLRRDHFCPTRPKVACSKCNLKMYKEYLCPHQVIYKCCKCNLSFPCEYLFKQHLTERTYPCQDCGKAFCDVPSLTNHVHSKHDKDKEVGVSWIGSENNHLPYKCDTCKIYFGTLNKWKKHMKMFHKENHCGFCAKTFASKSWLKNHVIKYHALELFFRSKSLLHKMEELKGDEVNIFESLSEFETETISHPKNPASSVRSCKQFTCDKCNKMFDSKTDLLHHFSTTHDLQDKKEVTCPMCGDTFAGKGSLTSHIKKKHLHSRFVHCNRCGRKYLQSMAKNHNMNYHKSGLKKKLDGFSCTQCGWTSYNRRFLANHLLREHNLGHLTKNCPLCKEDFPTLELRKAHICATRPQVTCFHCNHTMFEEYFLEHNLKQTCKDCSRTYLCEVSFIRHTRDRLFPCAECGRDFCSMDAWTKHVGRKHKNVLDLDVPWKGTKFYEQNLKCQECRTFFSSKESLQNHLDTNHGGDVCNLCAHWMPLGPEKMEDHIKNMHILISPYFQTMSEEKRKILCSRVLDNASVAGHSGDAELLLQPTHQGPTEMIHFTLNVKEDDFVYAMKKGTTFSGKEFSWICGTCSLFFPSKKLLEEHVLSSHTKFKMYCSFCMAELDNSTQHKLHMDTRHKDVIRPEMLGRALTEKCNICIANFEKVIDPSHRLISHFMRSKKNFVQCIICEETFKNELVGLKHFKAKHVLDSCVECSALMLGKYLEIHFSCSHASPG